MNDPNPLPPISSPFGGGTPVQPPALAPKNWADAPKIVKGWAYQLTWLGIITTPFFIFMSFSEAKDTVEAVITSIIYAAFSGFIIWLNIGLKKGFRGAWTAQFVVSVVGLLGFPLGTIIHGHILSKWSKPDVKAWFGRS